MVRVLYAPIIKNTTAAISHRFVYLWKLDTKTSVFHRYIHLWLYAAVVLLQMGANSTRNM
jgi:hypothetical protein